MENDGKDLHVLAAGVHGAAVVLHALGVVYNARRGNWWQALIHASVAAYDVWAIGNHARELSGPRLPKSWRSPKDLGIYGIKK